MKVGLEWKGSECLGKGCGVRGRSIERGMGMEGELEDADVSLAR
jgi:hypothetical protein